LIPPPLTSLVQALEPSSTPKLDSVLGYRKLLPKRQRIAVALPALSPEKQAEYKVVKEEDSLLPVIKRTKGTMLTTTEKST